MRAFAAAAPAVATLPSAAPPLTPDAAAVLSRAAADASRRRHAHTTPLHAAAALLSGPAPLLRDACVAGLASPHPLRCRALDLCFAVALDRLPTSTELQHHHNDGGFHAGAPPPLSNALAAALKRAYAHHRRIGGVEVDDHRVGVPHLVLAILDDPSVARVMREASFSSTAVKAAMLRSLSDPAAPDSGAYVNSARVMHHRQASSHREDEVVKVVEVLKRGKKRNPVLVGDTADVDAVVQEVFTLIKRQRLGNNARVISLPKELGDLVDMDRAELVAKIKELGEAVRSELTMAPAAPNCVVVNLGNLQWLVEERCAAAAQQQGEQAEKRRDVVLDTARAAVAEMARVLGQFGESVWVIGTATCATYLKCQVYHPALESEWDLQAVPITPRPPPPPPLGGLSSSVGVNRGILSSSVEVLSSAMTSTMQRAPSLCNACLDGYERERAEVELALRVPAEQSSMSQWLQIGTPSSARPLDCTQQEKVLEADELRRRRWRERCAQLHSHGGRAPLVTCSEWNVPSSVIGSMQQQPLSVVRPSLAHPSAGTVVDTDLALGPASTTSRPAACGGGVIDEKMLVRRLTEAVRWQPDAAAAVASTIAKAWSAGECNKRRGTSSRSDAWVLFAGPDAVGKRNMAEALSLSVFGTGAVTVRLGGVRDEEAGCCDDESTVVSCRGRTALNRVAEAVRSSHPAFRVVVLDGFDRADDVVRGSIVRAAERGRLVDSHGRDVSLGGNIFVATSQWWPTERSTSTISCQQQQSRADSPWNLETAAGKKRRPEEQALDDDGDRRRTRPRKGDSSPARKKPVPLDLNLSMSDDDHNNLGEEEEDDSGGEGSRNNSSSDLTVEHEQQDYQSVQPTTTAKWSAPSNVSELIRAVDGTVVFRPAAGFDALKRSVSDVVVSASGGGGWSSAHHVVDAGCLVADRLVAAAVGARAAPLETTTWTGEVLCPSSIGQFKRSFSSNDVDGATVEGSGRRRDGEMFPAAVSVTVTVDGN